MKIVNYILSFFTAISPIKGEDVPLSLNISQESIDLIIEFEVTSKSYYEKHLTHPEVPAWQSTSSGITVAIGYDCGAYSKEQIKKDMDGIVPTEQITLLQSVSGMKGKNAYYNGLPKVKYTVNIPYNQAEMIFKRTTLPSFTKQTANAFNLTKDRLHPHSAGALTSLVYNRGSSLANTDSRKEMRNIKYEISVNKESEVPNEIRSMRRLWSYTKLKGLWLRREAEAKLFQRGLNENHP